MQNNLKNPLASPSTIGVTSAAAFGANFGIIVLGGGSFHSAQGDAVYIMSPYIVTICAFIFSLTAIAIVIAISKIKNFSPQVIILAGVAISSLFGAGTTFLAVLCRFHTCCYCSILELWKSWTCKLERDIYYWFFTFNFIYIFYVSFMGL